MFPSTSPTPSPRPPYGVGSRLLLHTLTVILLAPFGPPPANATGGVPGSAAISANSDGGKEVATDLPEEGKRLAYGHVVDLQDQPIQRATVTLRASQPNADGSQPRLPADGTKLEVAPQATQKPPWTASTDERGRFEVPDIDLGTYNLIVVARGYASFRVPGLPVTGGEGPCDLGTVLLEPGKDLTGRVVNHLGRGLGGAEITARQRGIGRDSGIPLPEVETDPSGMFVLPDLSPQSRLDLRIEHSGFAALEVASVAPGDKVNMELEPVSSISGRIVGPDGPINGAEIEAQTSSPTAPHLAFNPSTTGSDSEGAFDLSNLTPGIVSVRVTAPGYQPRELEVTLPSRSPLSGLEIVLEVGEVLAGRVGSRQGPVARAQIAVHSAVGIAMRGHSDEEGRFEISGVPPGDLEIFVRHPDYPTLRRSWNPELSGDFVELELADGVRARGIVEGPGGEPIAAAQLEWNAVEGSEWRQASSDSEGLFEVEPMAPASYEVHIQAPGYGDLQRSVEITADGPQTFRFQLSRDGTLVGSITGLELADLQRLDISADRQGTFRGPAAVSFDGTYRLTGLGPGTWRVRARLADGFRERQAIVQITSSRETELDFELGGGFDLSGQINIDQRPAPALRVALYGREQPLPRIVTTDHLGRFRIAGLDPNLYRLEVRHDGLVESLDFDLVNHHDLLLNFDSPAVSHSMGPSPIQNR